MVVRKQEACCLGFGACFKAPFHSAGYERVQAGALQWRRSRECVICTDCVYTKHWNPFEDERQVHTLLQELNTAECADVLDRCRQLAGLGFDYVRPWSSAGALAAVLIGTR